MLFLGGDAAAGERVPEEKQNWLKHWDWSGESPVIPEGWEEGEGRGGWAGPGRPPAPPKLNVVTGEAHSVSILMFLNIEGGG